MNAMKKKPRKKEKPPLEEPFNKALDVVEYDRTLARMVREMRKKRHLSLSRAGRRSGITRQGWRKVERRKCSPTTHSDVLICNALRLRPSKLMSMVEDWLDREQHALAALVPPLLEALAEPVAKAGV